MGEKTGPNPTDRGKSGTKRSLVTDGGGIPIGLSVDGANRNDFKMLADTLGSLAAVRPEPSASSPQGLCLDKGYDYDEVRTLVEGLGLTAHIRCRGEEVRARAAGERARRWVVERTHSWMNRFRAVLVRWEKKGVNYLATLHFACAIITLRKILSG